MEHLLLLLVAGLFVLVRKLFAEGGLSKMLKKLSSELNEPDPAYRRNTPPPLTRQTPSARTPSANPEEERMRKFREALGLPPEDSRPQPHRQLPVPPIIAQPVKKGPMEAARQQRETIERKLAERKRALQQTLPSPIPKEEYREEDESVSKYFGMEEFNRPTIESEKTSVAVQVDTPIIEPDFFKKLEKAELVTVSSTKRLTEIFGESADLRRMILAQEILGRPKSLQNG